jgi:hypothetical protein
MALVRGVRRSSKGYSALSLIYASPTHKDESSSLLGVECNTVLDRRMSSLRSLWGASVFAPPQQGRCDDSRTLSDSIVAGSGASSALESRQPSFQCMPPSAPLNHPTTLYRTSERSFRATSHEGRAFCFQFPEA